jgi:hypothetical protein
MATKKCELCGKTLSIYNKGTECFHHAVDDAKGQHASDEQVINRMFLNPVDNEVPVEKCVNTLHIGKRH